jgi:hypothetical protein
MVAHDMTTHREVNGGIGRLEVEYDSLVGQLGHKPHGPDWK